LVKLSKKIEYALMSLRYIFRSKDALVSAREISAKFNIPHDLLAKILQKLKKEGILSSIQGINGGYKLEKNPNEISLSTLINIIDGNKGIVECLNLEVLKDCCMTQTCNIKSPVNQMQREIENLLNAKMISEFI
jgi:Rrf2 family protein